MAKSATREATLAAGAGTTLRRKNYSKEFQIQMRYLASVWRGLLCLFFILTTRLARTARSTFEFDIHGSVFGSRGLASLFKSMRTSRDSRSRRQSFKFKLILVALDCIAALSDAKATS